MSLYVPQKDIPLFQTCPSILDVLAYCGTMTLLRFFQAICPATGVYKQRFRVIWKS